MVLRTCLTAGVIFLVAVATAAGAPSVAQDKAAAQVGSPARKDTSPPTPVGVDPVRVDPLAQTVPVIGRLVASRQGVVAAVAGGPVDEIRVDVGDRVAAGAVVATLVKDRLAAARALAAAEVAQAVAALETAEANVTLLRQELGRIKRLEQSAAFSQARLQDKQQEVVRAESTVAERRAALQSARASLHLTDIDLRNAEVRAPFAGVVTQRHTAAGAYLGVGAPVVTVLDDRSLEIAADVPAERVPALSPGTLVECVLGKGDTVTAAVRAVVPDENPLTRTRSVRFTPAFGDDRAGLAANQSVTLHLPVGAAREVVTVHKDAVLNRKGQTLVYVVVDGKADVRPVTLGEATGSRFVVETGLRPGEPVVVRGNERLRPGQAVEINESLSGGGESAR